jgi:hypothetical protein
MRFDAPGRPRTQVARPERGVLRVRLRPGASFLSFDPIEQDAGDHDPIGGAGRLEGRFYACDQRQRRSVNLSRQRGRRWGRRSSGPPAPSGVEPGIVVGEHVATRCDQVDVPEDAPVRGAMGEQRDVGDFTPACGPGPVPGVPGVHDGIGIGPVLHRDTETQPRNGQLPWRIDGGRRRIDVRPPGGNGRSAREVPAMSTSTWAPVSAYTANPPPSTPPRSRDSPPRRAWRQHSDSIRPASGCATRKR